MPTNGKRPPSRARHGKELRTAPARTFQGNGDNSHLSSNHYDRKLGQILSKAAAVFCTRGYHQASVRDISRATGVSLAGLYYYFRSKEQLLYLIQRHTFREILAAARASLAPLNGPEERLRAFVRLHLQFFLERPNEMKVLTREEEWLDETHSRDLHATKRAYYKLCFDQVEGLKRAGKLRALNTRVAVLSLFGMMNWIYTWYHPGVDPDAEKTADHMTQIFLTGVYGSAELRNLRQFGQAKVQEEKTWQPPQRFPQRAR